MTTNREKCCPVAIMLSSILLCCDTACASLLGLSNSPEKIYSEPITMILLGIGLLGIAGLFKKIFHALANAKRGAGDPVATPSALPEESA